MLVIADQNTQHPTDGKTYYWTTSGGWYFSCLTSTATGNGKPGEGFLAIDPNGTRYWFDWIVEWDHPRISKGRYMAPLEPASGARPADNEGETNVVEEELVYELALLPRKKVAIYPTKIEDRFGNTVTYTWNSTYKNRLESIAAEDGRTISLTYTAGGQIDTVTAGTRTWDYRYTSNKLTEVELPDSSTWEYSLTALESLYTNDNPTTESPDCWGAIMSASQTAKTGTITHPSGATGTFTFRPTEHGRSFVDDSGSNCVPTTVPAPGGGTHTIWIAIHPWLFSSPSLEKKVITGVGLPAAGYEWTYDYGDPNNSKASCAGTCPDTKQVTVITKDDGTAVDWARYTFSNRYQQGEGKLVKTEVGSNAGNILRTTNQTWQLNPAGQPYPSRLGESPFRRSDRSAEKHAPLKQRDIVQQSRTFTWEATSWNLYAAPVEVDKYSTLGYTRTEKTTYRHDTGLWVLNQVSKLENLSEATVDTEIGYDATCALPTTTKRFGKLVETKNWNCATGNLDWVQDGAGATHRTEFSDYQRGVPKRIDFADGKWMSAVMDSNGQISSVTDQLGYVTSYEYDFMGRLNKVTYPGADTVAWATRNLIFEPAPSAEYGLAAGHWRRIETTGTHKVQTDYDAMWRPLVVREWDTAAEAATRRVTVTRYDHAGRVIYGSYPRNSATTDYLGSYDGVDTTYDSLGRVTGTLQDSELGTDPVTTTDYISGFKTRFTNARGQQTTTDYYAWDEPTTEFPKDSVEPGGVTTRVYRDSWGKPTRMRRNGSYTPPGGSAESYDLNRYYVYDAYERLCKTREPDAGITVMDYDSAGNIAWQAKGQYSLTNTTNCQVSNVPAGDKSTYHYDALNRVLAINHPTGTDDVGYTYFDDGAMQTATVGVLSGTSPVSWSSKRNEWTYTYNKRRLQETATLAVDGKTFTLDPTYNTLGHLTSLIYPSGYTISYAPNALGQPTKAANGGMNLASTASYYPNGAMAGFTYGNGITRTVTLNTRQLPGRILDQYGGTKTLDHTLTYDANANLKSITDGVNGQESRTLGYDGRDRLTSITGAPSGNESFTYDPLDRIRRITATGRDDRYTYSDAATGGSTYRLNRIHPAGNPTLGTSYAWNDRGELSTRTLWFEGAPPLGPNEIFGHGFEAPLSSYPTPFTFDRAGRLIDVQGATVQYDAHGHRVKNVEPPGYTRYHVYDQSGTLRYSEDGFLSQRKDYIDLNGTLVAERARPLSGSTETFSYHHTDHRRSATVRTASNRAVQYRTPFQAYGEPDGPFRNGPGFAGHEMEEIGGMVYMRQRYYDPAGFFISPDPIASSRVDFNPFAYARNNPYSFIDPDGRQADCNEACMRMRRASDRIGGGGSSTSSFISIENISTPYNYSAVKYVPLICEVPYKCRPDYGPPSSNGSGAVESLSDLYLMAVPPVFATTRYIGLVARTVTNPVPAEIARVVAGNRTLTTLGRAGADDVFVVAADDIAGLNAAQLSQRLTIPASDTFTIIQFPTPVTGIASPVFRTNPGFLQGGLTRGGAREYVIPNGPIPANATIKVVGQ